MEKIILDKLNWDLHMATPLDFLHIVSKGLLIFFLVSASANNVSRSTQTKILPVGEQRPWNVFGIPLYLWFLKENALPENSRGDLSLWILKCNIQNMSLLSHPLVWSGVCSPIDSQLLEVVLITFHCQWFSSKLNSRQQGNKDCSHRESPTGGL